VDEVFWDVIHGISKIKPISMSENRAFMPLLETNFVNGIAER
jgi:hypothetical protein